MTNFFLLSFFLLSFFLLSFLLLHRLVTECALKFWSWGRWKWWGQPWALYCLGPLLHSESYPWYKGADLVGYSLSLEMVSSSRLPDAITKEAQHLCHAVENDILLEPLGAIPQALTLLEVVRFITGRLRHHILGECWWGLWDFWKQWVCEYDSAPGPTL